MEGLDAIYAKPNLKIIVRAVGKAIGPDIREYLINNKMDTNNATRLLRGDFINTNLKHMFAGNEDVDLKHFKRFAWTGSLLIDKKHKVIITISARSTLHRVKKMNRRKNPHYVQTMCYVLNGTLEAPNKQLSIYDLDGIDIDPPFAEEVYEADFETIVDANAIHGNEYRYCHITYEADRFELKSISIILLDKDLDIVQKNRSCISLNPTSGILQLRLLRLKKNPRRKMLIALSRSKPD